MMNKNIRKFLLVAAALAVASAALAQLRRPNNVQRRAAAQQQQAAAEAKSVKAALERTGWTGDVEPVVCFASGTFQGDFATVGKVLVANAEAFVKWLGERPSARAPGDCARLVQLLETRDL